MANIVGDLDRAIECSINPELDQQVRDAALKFLNDVRVMPDAWKLALMKLFNSKNDNPLFFCFQVLEELFKADRYRTLPEPEQAELRRALLMYLGDKLCNPNHTTTFYLKNKFAQIIVLLFREDFPHRWPAFFDDLIAAVANDQTGMMTEMFLRIMLAIDEEVVSIEINRTTEEIQKNSVLKDQIRERAIGKIVDLWYHIMTKYAGNPKQRPLAMLALKNIALYTSWIDINFVANERMMNLFLKFLELEDFGEPIVDVFTAMVNKGMNPRDKMMLMINLKLTTILKAIKIVDDDDKVDFFEKVGKLINTMGLAILEAIMGIEDPNVNLTARNFLSELIPFLLACLNHPDDGVSESVIEFASQYTHYIKNFAREHGGHIENSLSEHLRQFLKIIAFKCRFDENFDFVKADANEETFLKFRKSLANLFKLITQLEPQMVASLVHEHLVQLRALSEHDALQPNNIFQIEITLWMFYKMGEGLAEDLLQKTRDFFVSTIDHLVRGAGIVSNHPHPAISNIYFNVIFRYAKLLQNTPQTLQPVLASLLDHRGVRSQRPYTRAKCCDILVRIVRTAQLRNDLLPMIPMIVDSLRDLLQFTPENLANRMQNSPQGKSGSGTFNLTKGSAYIPALPNVPDTGLFIEDKFNLYEALGVLIGGLSTEHVKADQYRFLELVLSNAVDGVAQIVGQELYKHDNDDNPRYTGLVCDMVRAIGTFSKGFPQNPSKSSENMVKFFVPTLERCMKLVQWRPKSVLVRSASLFYMHRMIGCLGPAIFPYLPAIITLFITEAGTNDLVDTIVLINQIMSTFKESVFDVVDQLLMPLVEHIFQHIQRVVASGITLKSEEERELVNLRKHYYLFVQTLSNSIPQVLISARNAPKLNDILDTIVEGCKFYADTNIQRLCVGVFRKLVPLWAGTEERFTQFLFTRVLRMTFEVPSSKEFHLDDGLTQNTFLELCLLMQDIYKKCAPTVQYLSTVLFPQINCPSDFVQPYLHHLTSSQPRDFRKFLTDFYGPRQS